MSEELEIIHRYVGKGKYITLIQSEVLHDFFSDYYDKAYKKNKVWAMKNLSKPISDFKQFIDKLEKRSVKK